MNMSFTVPYGLKQKIWTGTMDFDTDTFKMLLVRPDFQFNSTEHLLKKNIQTSTASGNLRVLSAARYVERETGSFVTEGYVTNNLVTFAGDAGDANTNDGAVWKVRLVEATKLYVSSYESSVFYDEDSNTAGEPPVTTVDYFTASISSDDELSTSTTGAESYTPGGVVVTFTISGDKLLLDSIEPSDFGGMSALLASGGGVIWNDSATDKDIVAFARFAAYELYL